jgi:hypothetical protein
MNDGLEFSSSRIASIASKLLSEMRLGIRPYDADVASLAGSALTQYNPRAEALRSMLRERYVSAQDQADALRRDVAAGQRAFLRRT